MLGSLDMWQGVPVADAEPSHKEGPVAQSLIFTEAAAFRFTARSRQKLANLIVAHFPRVPFLMERNRALDPCR